MKFILDLAPEAYERIMRVIESDEPAAIVRFIRLAVENQLTLEEVEEGSYREVLGVPSGDSLYREANSDDRLAPWQGLRINEIHWEELPTVPSPGSVEGPLWGQYNRLLPVKVGLRVLAGALNSSTNGLNLDEFHRVASEKGIQVRRFLTSIDASKGTPRGERLSTAFPQLSEKSVNRFQTHFLGYVRRDGVAVGALPEFGFISISPESPNEVRMTDKGLTFARLPNPVIEGDSIPAQSMSPAEVDFLLAHVRSSMPGEFRFLINLLRWISQGLDSPDSLTRQVQRANPDWSGKMASTMRAGSLGRMQELGLVTRSHEGRRVTYLLEEAGQRLLEEGAG